MDDPCCKICHEQLNVDELKYFKDNWETEVQYIGYHCKKTLVSMHARRYTMAMVNAMLYM